ICESVDKALTRKVWGTRNYRRWLSFISRVVSRFLIQMKENARLITLSRIYCKGLLCFILLDIVVFLRAKTAKHHDGGVGLERDCPESPPGNYSYLYSANRSTKITRKIRRSFPLSARVIGGSV